MPRVTPRLLPAEGRNETLLPSVMSTTSTQQIQFVTFIGQQRQTMLIKPLCYILISKRPGVGLSATFYTIILSARSND